MITIIVNNFTCIERNNKRKREEKKKKINLEKESKNHDESSNHFKFCISIQVIQLVQPKL